MRLQLRVIKEIPHKKLKKNKEDMSVWKQIQANLDIFKIVVLFIGAFLLLYAKSIFPTYEAMEKSIAKSKDETKMEQALNIKEVLQKELSPISQISTRLEKVDLILSQNAELQRKFFDALEDNRKTLYNLKIEIEMLRQKIDANEKAIERLEKRMEQEDKKQK